MAVIRIIVEILSEFKGFQTKIVLVVHMEAEIPENRATYSEMPRETFSNRRSNMKEYVERK